MARNRFIRKLNQLRHDVTDMGAITLQSVEDALTALETSDTALVSM